MPADPFETPLILTEATILPTSLVYIRRTCGPILFPDLLSIPIHRLAKPFFKINGHSIPERLLRSVDRGLRISHVSRAGCFMNRFDVAAEDLFNLRQQIEQGVAASARHVECAARDALCFGCQQVRIHYVIDKCEVARLKSITINDRSFAVEQSSDESRDHRCVLGLGVLARAEDVEVAKRHDFETINMFEHTRVVLPHELR